jgi:hypothetical protein
MAATFARAARKHSNAARVRSPSVAPRLHARNDTQNLHVLSDQHANAELSIQAGR